MRAVDKGPSYPRSIKTSHADGQQTCVMPVANKIVILGLVPSIRARNFLGCLPGTTETLPPGVPVSRTSMAALGRYDRESVVTFVGLIPPNGIFTDPPTVFPPG